MNTHDDESEAANDFPLTDDLIDDDMPCLRCDYNLRGLRPDGRCPECGAPVEETVAFVMQRVLCPTCCHPNHPISAICSSCGNALSASAATANFGLRRSIAPAPRAQAEDEEESEPVAPSLAYVYICWMISAAILVKLGFMTAAVWSDPGQPMQTLNMILGDHMVRTLLLLAVALVPVLTIVLPARNYIRLRREYVTRRAEYTAREAAKDAAYKEPGT